MHGEGEAMSIPALTFFNIKGGVWKTSLMKPIGYLVQRPELRLTRPITAYDRWVKRTPEEYARSVLGAGQVPQSLTLETDGNRIATVKHFRSLILLGQEARKPVFDLTVADGAMGSHAAAAT